MGDFNFKNNGSFEGMLIEHFYSGDIRGGFGKIFEKKIYEDHGIKFHIDEVFISESSKNVIRGIHFQMNEPQAKIVTILEGKAWDVVVDLRPESPNFKKWVGFELNEEDHRAVYVPRGFGHGFYAYTDKTKMLYLCDGKYDPASDTGILYDDPVLDIKWPVEYLEDTIHSERDLNLMSFEDYIKKI